MAIGAPDFYIPSFPAKTTLGPGQYRFKAYAALEGVNQVAADSYTEVEIYTVPTGYVLYIGLISVTCSTSLIQRFELIDGLNNVITMVNYDVNTVIPEESMSSYEFVAGETIKVRMYNYLSTATDQFFLILGTLEVA